MVYLGQGFDFSGPQGTAEELLNRKTWGFAVLPHAADSRSEGLWRAVLPPGVVAVAKGAGLAIPCI